MGRIVICLGAIALVALFRVEASDYPATAARLPGLLGWVTGSLALLGIGQAVLGFRWDSADGSLGLFPAQDWRGIALGAAFLGLIVLYAWSITRIGYLIATPLFLLIPLIALRPVGWRTTILTTAGVTVFIWSVFVWFLNLSIPLYPDI